MGRGKKQFLTKATLIKIKIIKLENQIKMIKLYR